MHLFSQSLSIVLRCGGLLLNVIVSFSSTRGIQWPGLDLIRLSCRCVIDVMLQHCMLYKVNSNSNHCLFSQHPPASVRVRNTRVRHTRAAAAAHPIEFEISRCRTSQFVRCSLPAQTRVWNDLLHTLSGHRNVRWV